MKLSRIELDVSRRSTMKALGNPNLIHGALEAGAEGERQHPLWRIDQLGERYYLLTITADSPPLEAVARQFGAASNWQTRDYDGFLQKIEDGSRWRFRLVANPTYSASVPNVPNQRGKVHAHTTPEHQRAWLVKQSEKCGFSLEEDEFQVVGSHWVRFSKNGRRNVTLLSVAFEGFLTVTDAAQFVRILTGGIGRGKAYGMGLMTVVPVHE